MHDVHLIDILAALILLAFMQSGSTVIGEPVKESQSVSMLFLQGVRDKHASLFRYPF